MTKVEIAIAECVEEMDQACRPECMTVLEAIAFWRGIIDEVQIRLEALSEDLARAEASE